MMDDTCFESVIGTMLNSASAPRALIRIDGVLSTFLYHCVSDPCTGRRYRFSWSNTNQTGIEMARPEFLPVTVILIPRYRERRSFRASFPAGMCTPPPNFLSLQLLARGPEQDLVHVPFLGLAHGESDDPSERFGLNGDIRIELAVSLGGIRMGHAVRPFRCYHAW